MTQRLPKEPNNRLFNQFVTKLPFEGIYLSEQRVFWSF